MVNLDRLRLDMEKRLAKDREIHTVEVMADTLDECLADAAVQLETKVSNLEYEVIEKGFSGIMGLAKKPWKVRVYENPDVAELKKKQTEEQMFAADEFAQEEKIVDKDGYYYVHRFASGLFLKVNLSCLRFLKFKIGAVSFKIICNIGIPSVHRLHGSCNFIRHVVNRIIYKGFYFIIFYTGNNSLSSNRPPDLFL
jgi:hypothetical protein